MGTNINSVLLLATGRSGSNFLIKVFDLSPSTFCRYDWPLAYSSPRSPHLTPCLKEAERASFSWDNLNEELDPSEISSLFPRACDWLSQYSGVGDKPSLVDKDFYHTFTKRLNLHRLIFSKRGRGVLRLLRLGDANNTNHIPTNTCLYQKQALTDAIKVYKWLPNQSCLNWLNVNNSSLPLIHLFRHPGGYLNSWEQRFASGEEHKTHLERNQFCLSQIAKKNPSWAQPFVGRIETTSLVESELWMYRYQHETIYQSLKKHPLYLPVSYEKICADPLTEIRNLYKHVKLDWSPAIEQHVRKLTHNSLSKTETWKKKLTGSSIELIHKVFENSQLPHPID